MANSTMNRRQQERQSAPTETARPSRKFAPLRAPFRKSRPPRLWSRFRIAWITFWLSVATVLSVVAWLPSTATTKSIESIQVGDWVLAEDPATHQVESRQVTRLFRNTQDHLRLVTIQDRTGQSERIETTDEHPFWVPSKGWTNARELHSGDTVLQTDGQTATVVGTSREEHPEGIATYNFEVEGLHTYFVAARGFGSSLVLVHNTCEQAPKNAPYGSTPEGRPFTKHYGTETGPQRNIPGSVVDNTINTTKGVPGRNGTTVHYDPVNDVTVVTGNGGSIVSVRRGPLPKGE